MIDLKVINSVIEQMEQERGVPKAKMLEAIEMAFDKLKEIGEDSKTPLQMHLMNILSKYGIQK